MPSQSIPLPWDQSDWLDWATTWIHAQLATAGRQVESITVLHQRPWSTFARITTDQGIVYFKAPAPAFRYEAALTQFLAHRYPACTTPVLAIEPEQGWLLTVDAGITLNEVDPTPTQVDHWVALLPRYVELQMGTVAQVPELLAAGMPDRRLAALPQLYLALLADQENLLIGQESGLTTEEYQQLQGLQAQFADWCAELAGYGLPETLCHEEVHSANVLRNGDGRYIFTDWSDSSVAHPFFTMLVTMRAAAHRLKLAEDGPELARLQDAYLEPWTALLPRKQLQTAYDLAYRLAMVNRALSWHAGTASLPQQHKAPYADSVPGWLQDFLIFSSH